MGEGIERNFSPPLYFRLAFWYNSRMAHRTSIIDLRASVRVLNEMVGAVPGTPGSYVLQGAYGGWQLQKVLPTGTTIIFPGFRPKTELLNLIHAFRAGIRVGQETVFPPAASA
jgi:hypothetical protein